MKKSILLLTVILVAVVFSAKAQKIVTKAVDNKGTIKWVIDSATAIITKADSTILYVTPHQLQQSQGAYVKIADSAAMLAPYLNAARNGLTKDGQAVKLGGELTEVTTIQTSATNFLALTGLQAGNQNDSLMVVNPTTGQIKFVSAAGLYNALSFENGLTRDGNIVKLGGTLYEPTTLATDEVNTLKITGLQSGNVESDSLVLVAADGTLKRAAAKPGLTSGSQDFVATAGQNVYAVADLPTIVSKIWVYRNGVKLIAGTDYVYDAGTVTLTATMAALIQADDAIEVQWVK
jgi:hypothetical protein